ncbi:hypothetical protein MtrunA17_Chr4g0063961 [Medicago truncatula]|uniref:Uncharacterized protein n=1 Tax=Medicago truncatula TaxID=3880 RepID=A0A396IEF3_MEDTR|nr:hypothetical protein MtrunA17_Chr4g0063961 [Medicago truncatula]
MCLKKKIAKKRHVAVAEHDCDPTQKSSLDFRTFHFMREKKEAYFCEIPHVSLQFQF